ncbi:MAG: polymerase [Devosia sp.]|uniref:uracil-DNA glycosylase n=1 Tax=Devosia sp. TaxID=1871048 RepID=UPI00260B22C7|nr:uracil-DNA glycosylase [Devosia sp.]MDB5540659.1 polymerase [Devosia sp.]
MSENRPLNNAEARAALDWYRAVGVDFAVGEEPVDRFAASAAPSRARPAPVAEAAAARPVAAAPAPIAISLTADPTETTALAAGARTLDELRAVMEAYDGCLLKKRATQLVFADGNPEAEIMLVGEGPGEQEDLQGKPFVGRAGQLLDRMLGSIGLDRSKVYIANMVPWRPPGNRDPTPEEMALCTPFLLRQVELVAPKFLVTLGNVPTKSLFRTENGITRMRGQWRDLTVGSHTMRALATLHPAYLLRTPASKALAWRDMLSLKQAIEGERA